MSWQARLRREAGVPTVLMSVIALIVVSCVTVAQEPAGIEATFPPGTPDATARAEPAVTETAAGASPESSPWAIATAIATRAPTASPTEPPAVAPVVAATPTATPTLAPTSTPSPTVTPAPASAMPSPLTAATDTAVGTSLDKASRRKLRSILTNQVKNKGIAGLQAAVRLPSGETWLGTAGMAEFAPDRAIEDDTVFSIASVTKTFIAALILQLVDEGKIDLDAPFGTYFKDAPRQRHATVRQLLSHTSGIYNYFENPRYTEITRAWLRATPTGVNSREREWSYDEIMDLVKNRGYCKIGKCYHYSNTNFVILGQVAEAVEGKPLHKQLRRRFFDPLGMEDTVYQPEERPGPNAAHGHWANVGGGFNDHTRSSPLVPFMAATSVADAAGAIASTARDLSIWADALYGGELLSEASLRQMTTILTEGTYGLGTDVAVFAGKRGYGHRGGLRGFESSMWHFPESGVSVVLLSNQGNWGTDAPMQKLVKAAHR